jgi:hypothetical protein
MTATAQVLELEPGVHPGVAADVYRGWDAVSNSALTHLLRSPAHLREALDHPRPSSEEQVLGTAAHTLVLEPEAFSSLYTAADQCRETTGKGARCSRLGAVRRDGDWYCSQHDPDKGALSDPVQVLAPDQWERAHRIRDAVLAHESASYLVGLAGDVEVSLLWDDADSGVRCKGRPDKLARSIDAVVDLKTTQDAGRESFVRSIYNFGYFRQAAMYLGGLQACELAFRHFVIIAAEKTPPYGVAVYRLNDDVVEAGRAQLRALLATYRYCQERGEWPCYPGEIQNISLPRWAWGQIESED